MTHAETVAYFWSNVRKTKGCWLWMGFKNRGGYGQFHSGTSTSSKKETRKTERAHRFSWKIHNGAIPEGLNVLHRCDNTRCVNPKHLWIGTQIDNVRDMTAKGRRVDQIGSKHGRAKLNEAAVASLRRRHAAKEISYSWIMKEYGLTKRTVAMMIKRLTWKHVTEAA